MLAFGVSCFFSDFLPVAMSRQSLHGCLPSKVFTKAGLRGSLCENFTNMPTHATD